MVSDMKTCTECNLSFNDWEDKAGFVVCWQCCGYRRVRQERYEIGLAVKWGIEEAHKQGFDEACRLILEEWSKVEGDDPITSRVLFDGDEIREVIERIRNRERS